MADITVDNLSELLEIVQREQKEEQKNASTFLEIIGRSRRETYVSSLLAYVIRKDDGLLAKLLRHALKKDVPEVESKDVTCEYAMSGGRADIFVTGKFKGGAAFTLTIENKVDSWEHGGQTTVYYKYVTKHYKGRNAFIYLKPDDSQSMPECGSFTELTYSQLNSMIKGGMDSITDDFKKHIENNFSGKNTMNETDAAILKIMERYGEYKNLFNKAKNELDHFRKEIVEMLNKGLKDNYSGCRIINLADYISVDKPEWKGNDYWFYAELYFKDYDLSTLFVKASVKVYNDNEDITGFCDERRISEKGKNPRGYVWDNGGDDAVKVYFTFKELPFMYSGNDGIFSMDWKRELKDFTCAHIPGMMDLLEKEFSKFQIFLNEHENKQ